MKVAILAGGESTRMGSNATGVHKALTPIGDTPVLEHLIRYYQRFGYTEFVIALGHHSRSIIDSRASWPDWPAAVAAVLMVDTGRDTDTGGRLKRLAPYLDDTFMLTWCDGLADIDLHALEQFHWAHDGLATVTAVRPPPRFGSLELDAASGRILTFSEKTNARPDWINGAFFVLEPDVFDYIEGDATSLERDVLPVLAEARQLYGYQHKGFWRCLDTPKEAAELDAMWRAGEAPWLTPTKTAP